MATQKPAVSKQESADQGGGGNRGKKGKCAKTVGDREGMGDGATDVNVNSISKKRKLAKVENAEG